MDLKEFIDQITERTNISKNQTQFLLDLLNGDYMRLIILEEKIKNNMLFYCPGNRDDIEEILNMPNDTKFILNDVRPLSYMVDQEFKFIKTGHTGKIIQDLISDKKSFKPQFGIYWYGGNEGDEHVELIKKYGVPNYWVDKNSIVLKSQL